MPIPRPVTKTKISTVAWGIPITDAVNKAVDVDIPALLARVTALETKLNSTLVAAHALGTASDSAGVTATTDVPGLSVTFVAQPTFVYRTTIYVSLNQGAASGITALQLADGTNAVMNASSLSLATGEVGTITMQWVETGLSGSLTRKARFGTSAGNVIAIGSFSRRNSIVVERIA